MLALRLDRLPAFIPKQFSLAQGHFPLTFQKLFTPMRTTDKESGDYDEGREEGNLFAKNREMPMGQVFR